MDFHTRERSMELALLLKIIQTGASGDGKANKALMDELLKHGQ